MTLMLDATLYLTAKFISYNVICMLFIFKARKTKEEVAEMIRRMEEAQRDRDELLKQAQEVYKFDDIFIHVLFYDHVCFLLVKLQGFSFSFPLHCDNNHLRLKNFLEISRKKLPKKKPTEF
jgi:hypothetical protein